MRAALALGDLPSTSAVLLCATVIKCGGEVIQQRSTCRESNRRARADAGSDCRSTGNGYGIHDRGERGIRVDRRVRDRLARLDTLCMNM